MVTTRKFNGKTYVRGFASITKTAAKSIATGYKKKGWSVRTVSTGIPGKYAVYYRR